MCTFNRSSGLKNCVHYNCVLFFYFVLKSLDNISSRRIDVHFKTKYIIHAYLTYHVQFLSKCVKCFYYNIIALQNVYNVYRHKKKHVPKLIQSLLHFI